MACPKTSWHGERVSRQGCGRLLICAIAGALACSAVAGAAPDSLPPPGRIVYSKPLGDGRRALFVGRADGSDAVPITAGPNDYNAQWSPDGRRVAFERSVAEDTSAVWVANGEDGSSARELDSDPYAEHPRWSPDGLWIAYQVQTSAYIYDAHRANTTFELWAVRPNGSNSGQPQLLVDSEPLMENDNPRAFVEFGAWSWSPDSRRIAFTRPRRLSSEVPGVNVVDVATGRIRFLGAGEDPSWSPGGQRLAVSVDTEYSIGEPGCGSVWIVSVTGGSRRRLARPPRETCDRFPRWSPDGRTIVFVREPAHRFMAATPDGTFLRRVAPLHAAAYRWPRDCSTLFEYVNPFDAGWVVRDTRGRTRFVSFLTPGGDWRCTSGTRT